MFHDPHKREPLGKRKMLRQSVCGGGRLCEEVRRTDEGPAVGVEVIAKSMCPGNNPFALQRDIVPVGEAERGRDQKIYEKDAPGDCPSSLCAHPISVPANSYRDYDTNILPVVPLFRIKISSCAGRLNSCHSKLLTDFIPSPMPASNLQ